MKKIYFLQKIEVELGDLIAYKGFKSIVTEELISLNPELFRVEEEKTLNDYENMLLRTNIDSVNAREVCWFYSVLKGKEPKLYYTKILQLIADDLNDGRYIHIRRNASYHLSNAGEVNIHYGGDEGAVYFKAKELAVKARNLLGDKVKYLFNN